MKITSIKRLTNGHITLQGLGVPSAAHTIERSPTPDSAGFSALAPTTADGAGLVQFEDSTSTGLDRAFYRLAYP